MSILPDDIVKKGSVTIYLDTDRKTEENIRNFNNEIDGYRARMKNSEEMRFAFAVTNPLIIAGVTATQAADMFSDSLKLISGLILLVLYAVLLVVFVVMKENLLVCAAVSFAFIPYCLLFILLAVLNVILCLWFMSIRNSLKDKAGYPAFNRIFIRYSRENEPKADADGQYERY